MATPEEMAYWLYERQERQAHEAAIEPITESEVMDLVPYEMPHRRRRGRGNTVITHIQVASQPNPSAPPWPVHPMWAPVALLLAALALAIPLSMLGVIVDAINKPEIIYLER